MAENTTEAPAPSYSVRNLARDPLSRVKRRLRPGNKTGFLLSDGTRLRRRGVRGTELDSKTLKENAERLCEGIEEGYIEVCDPSGAVMTGEAVMAAAGGKAPKKEAPKTQVKAEEPATEPEPVAETQVEPAADTEVQAAPQEPDEEKPKKKKKGGLFGRKKEGKE